MCQAEDSKQIYQHLQAAMEVLNANALVDDAYAAHPSSMAPAVDSSGNCKGGAA